MGFVVKRPSRMQGQCFFSKLGGAGGNFRSCSKIIRAGEKNSREGCPRPDLTPPIVRRGGGQCLPCIPPRTSRRLRANSHTSPCDVHCESPNESVQRPSQDLVVCSQILRCSVKSYVTGPSIKCYFNDFYFMWFPSHMIK